jgi:hypothetical protein
MVAVPGRGTVDCIEDDEDELSRDLIFGFKKSSSGNAIADDGSTPRRPDSQLSLPSPVSANGSPSHINPYMEDDNWSGVNTWRQDVQKKVASRDHFWASGQDNATQEASESRKRRASSEWLKRSKEKRRRMLDPESMVSPVPRRPSLPRKLRVRRRSQPAKDIQEPASVDQPVEPFENDQEREVIAPEEESTMEDTPRDLEISSPPVVDTPGDASDLVLLGNSSGPSPQVLESQTGEKPSTGSQIDEDQSFQFRRRSRRLAAASKKSSASPPPAEVERESNPDAQIQEEILSYTFKASRQASNSKEAEVDLYEAHPEVNDAVEGTTLVDMSSSNESENATTAPQNEIHVSMDDIMASLNEGLSITCAISTESAASHEAGRVVLGSPYKSPALTTRVTMDTVELPTTIPLTTSENREEPLVQVTEDQETSEEAELQNQAPSVEISQELDGNLHPTEVDPFQTTGTQSEETGSHDKMQDIEADTAQNEPHVQQEQSVLQSPWTTEHVEIHDMSAKAASFTGMSQTSKPLSDQTPWQADITIPQPITWLRNGLSSPASNDGFPDGSSLRVAPKSTEDEALCNDQTYAVPPSTPETKQSSLPTPEHTHSIRSFRDFMTPSPQQPRRMTRVSLSNGRLPSTQVLADAARSNPWKRKNLRVTWAPLPGESAEETALESCRTRAQSPPLAVSASELPAENGRFGKHFAKAARKGPQLRRGRSLLPSESQQVCESPEAFAMAEAFIEADERQAGTITHEDDTTPEDSQSGGDEEIAVWDMAPSVDDVSAVMENLDDFLNSFDVDVELDKARSEAQRTTAFPGDGLDSVMSLGVWN